MPFASIYDRWVNLPLFARFLISVGAAALIGFGVVRPGYGAFKSWKVSRDLVAAGRAMEAGQMDRARDLSLTVLKSGDSGIEPLRILEKSSAALGDPRHGEISKALLTHSQATDEDRWRGFDGIAGVAPLGVVSQAWASLPDACRLQSRFAANFAERLIAEGKLPEATAVLLNVKEKDRTPELRRMVVRVLIHSGKKEGFEEAQRRIASEFPQGDEDREPWLALLEEVPPLELDDHLLAPVRRILEAPAFSDNPREQLMLARMEGSEDGTKRSEIAAAAAGRWKDKAPVPVARFLTDLGMPQELATLFPVAVVERDLELQRLVLAAMAKTGAWTEMLHLLDAAGQKMPKFEESAWRAVVSFKRGDEPGKAQHWAEALGEARSGSVADGLLQVMRIARKAGMDGEADQAMIEAIKAGKGPLPLFNDILPLIASLEDKERENLLMEIYAVYLPLEPGNPALFTRYAYLACLNRLVEPPALLGKLETLAKSFPKEAMLQWVLATVYLCDGKPKKAEDVLTRAGEGDLEGRVQGYRIAWLTTEVMNRRIPPDDPRITGFPWTTLKASERKRFGELIASVPK